ncbi:WD repeat-containing protein 55 like protein [Melipona quadrifasciata]|uniref:WD repeat-containing protein 55 homolog n=1 Tax=Melipona quadrifasciata TaxID=166423 RepID=A0A0N0U6G8_9HYME|nr:WD repeat-containing protein 55 like protein [Melipona quadrifasciata]
MVNMKLATQKNRNFTLDNEENEENDETDNSIETSSDDSSLSSSDDEELPDSNNAHTSGSTEPTLLNTNEEEDEVIKAIIKSKNINTNHPPTITTEDHVVDICFHPNSNMIAVANIVGDIHLYKYNNTETELMSTLELHLKALYTMTVIGEHMFATGDDNGIVKVWDLRDPKELPIFTLKKMEDYVSAIVTNKEAKYLVCASGDGCLTTFNIPGKKLHVQSEEYEEELTCLGLFKSETKLLVGTSKGKLYVYNWGEFGLHSDEFPNLTKKAINCMIPITENVLASSLFPHNHLGIVGQHNLSIEALDVNSDGTLIASSSHDNDIKFWNVQYFETLDVNERVKGGKQKQLKRNLPSSKIDNVSNFFSDLQ